MLKALHKTLSLSLALLVLLSTFSFTVDKHFCGSILVDKAIFSEAKTCGMEMNANTTSAEDSCCTNEKTAIEGQDELKLSFSSLDLEQQQILVSFTYVFLSLFEGEPLEVIPFKDYSPPLLVTDIHILDQVFLI